MGTNKFYPSDDGGAEDFWAILDECLTDELRYEKEYYNKSRKRKTKRKVTIIVEEENEES